MAKEPRSAAATARLSGRKLTASPKPTGRLAKKAAVKKGVANSRSRTVGNKGGLTRGTARAAQVKARTLGVRKSPAKKRTGTTNKTVGSFTNPRKIPTAAHRPRG